MKKIVLAGICLVLFVAAAQAEIMYVTDVFDITLRTGKGTDHKVKKMLHSGQALEVLEFEKDWTHVRVSEGDEGWVVSRFLKPEKTSEILLNELRAKHKRILGQLSTLKEDSSKYKMENGKLSAELTNTKEMLASVSKSYETLKTESADFLDLKKKYKRSTAQLSEITEKAGKLQKENIQKYIIAGLCGAGILLFGFIIGFSTKSQRRRPSLL